MGPRAFLKYYFLCGIGAGVCVVVANLLFSGNWKRARSAHRARSSGCSLAFGYLYPDREVLFSFLFPIKAKYFVMIIGAIAFLSSLQRKRGRRQPHRPPGRHGDRILLPAKPEGGSDGLLTRSAQLRRFPVVCVTKNGKSSAPSGSSRSTCASGTGPGPRPVRPLTARNCRPPGTSSVIVAFK